MEIVSVVRHGASGSVLLTTYAQAGDINFSFVGIQNAQPLDTTNTEIKQELWLVEM